MARTIIVEDRERIASLYSLNLKVYAGTDIIWKRNYQGVMDVLKVIPEIDLIITRVNTSKEPAALKIVEYLEIHQLDIPVIVYGEEPKLKGKVHFLDAGIDVAKLIPLAAELLGVTAKTMARLVVPNFYEIPLTYFFHMESTICDVFLRILKKNTEPQYVGVLKEGEEFNYTMDSIRKYVDKGVKSLFVEAQFRLAFVNDFSKQITDKLLSEKLTVDERIKATETSMDFIAEEFLSQGLTENAITVSKASMESIVRVSNTAIRGKLSHMVGKLMSQGQSYRYKHSQLISILAAFIIDKIEWGTQDHIEKLTYAAFFHDILLDKDELAQIHTFEDLEEAELDYNDKRLVEFHALWALELMAAYPDAPIGGNQLIKQHHGTTNGIGFSSSLNSNFSPLTQIFIVSEEYAHYLLANSDKKPNFQHFMQTIPEKLRKPRFLKFLELFNDFHQ